MNSMHLKNIKTPLLDHQMKDAVITVPAYYNQAERRAILE